MYYCFLIISSRSISAPILRSNYNFWTTLHILLFTVLETKFVTYLFLFCSIHTTQINSTSSRICSISNYSKIISTNNLLSQFNDMLKDIMIIADGMLQFPSISKFPSGWNAFRLIPVHANNAINETIDETIETIYSYDSTPFRLSLITILVVVELHSVKFNRDSIGNGLFENKLGIPSGLLSHRTTARNLAIE